METTKYVSRHTGEEIDSLLDKVKEGLVDKSTYYATAMIGRFAGASLGPYESNILTRFPDLPSYTNMSLIFAGASFYHEDGNPVVDIGDLNNTISSGVSFSKAFERTTFHYEWNSNKVTNEKIFFGNGRVRFDFSFNKCNVEKVLVKDGTTCKIVSCSYGFYGTPCDEIGAFDLSECNNLVGAFEGCPNLSLIHCKNFKMSFNISSSTRFTESALVEIVGNLTDLTGKTPRTLTMGATNLAKLTDEEKAVATSKNWVLA